MARLCQIILVSLAIPAVLLQAQHKATLTRANIVYSIAGSDRLTMDYYAPKDPGPHPAVILLHSGGFVAGDSHSPSELYCADFLVPAGYAVFSLNYRLAPQHPYPAMVEDTQNAIRYLRLHATSYNIAPDKIILVGGSAGGYLSNMVGVLNSGPLPQAKTPQDRQSARANAVVTLYGITDFEALPVSEHERQFLAPLIQQKGLLAAQREASPIHHITSDDPPFLQIIGDKDEYFPTTQVERFDLALRATGVRSQFLIIPGGTHGTDNWNQVPNGPDWEREMLLWLNRVLNHDGPIGEGIRSRIRQ